MQTEATCSVCHCVEVPLSGTCEFSGSHEKRRYHFYWWEPEISRPDRLSLWWLEDHSGRSVCITCKPCANNSYLCWLGAVEDWQCWGLFTETRSELYILLLRFSKCLETDQNNIFIKLTHELYNVLIICYFSLANLENTELIFREHSITFKKGSFLSCLSQHCVLHASSNRIQRNQKRASPRKR